MDNNWVVIFNIHHLKLNKTKILEIVWRLLQWKYLTEKHFTIFSYYLVIMLWDPRNSDTDSIISEMILKIQHLITEYHKKNNSLFSLQLPEKKKTLFVQLKVKVKVAQCIRLFATPCTIQALEFSRTQYWSG